MSDLKTTLNLTSLVTKKTRRAKARILQGFGKADKTTDELFEVYQSNFARQQTTANNLQKHVKQYIHCLKELHEVSKGLNHCLLEMHEQDWPKHDVFENNAYEMEHISEDLEEKLKESVLVPLEQYIGQFAEMREKISKRGRKLVDYDSQRHSFEALQQHQTGKPDDTKLIKAREQLEDAKRVYESLNNDLHEELPALYDNRLPFIITVFQRLFSSKITYHDDNLGVQKSYLDTVEQLAKASEKGNFTSAATVKQHQQQQKQLQQQQQQLQQHVSQKQDQHQVSSHIQASNEKSNGSVNERDADQRDKTKVDADQSSRTPANNLDKSEGDQPARPPVYLHKVRATYKYLAEDDDELSFEAGEIIHVIEYDDPQEQEEGWLMGIKESTGQRGLFPANFTKEL